MSHWSSEKVCADIVKMVTFRGEQMLRENRTVKNYLSAFADMKAL
jgi:hypothetical protein